jgi:hypothetical protein
VQASLNTQSTWLTNLKQPCVCTDFKISYNKMWLP